VPLQTEIASITVPAVLAVQNAIQSVDLPVATPTPTSIEKDVFAEEATKLIVRWEITGPSMYDKKYQGVIWPGGASGPTWAVGYDGGHQTRRTIGADWIGHSSVDRLQESSGVTGQTAQLRVKRGDWRGITTEYPYALDVFAKSTLPSYKATAQRAFGAGFRDLSPMAQAALTSLVYNRGGQMTGARRAEMRSIRDQCIPSNDVACIARELRAMCRLWEGTPNGIGLCKRRNDEARVAQQ